MAIPSLREELLDLLTAGSRPRALPCHGYCNLCSCPACKARGEQNELILYADRRDIRLDRPTARRMLFRYGRPRSAKRVVDEMVTAAKRKIAA